jgi:hypothetical protein
MFAKGRSRRVCIVLRDVDAIADVGDARECSSHESPAVCAAQRKVFTTPLLSEAQSDRNTEQFTKKKSRCQRGGVRGVANQNAATERTILQTKQRSKDEAAALRKNHVGGH